MANAMSPKMRVALAAGAVVLAAYGVWTFAGQVSPGVSDQARPVITQLTDMAGRLDAADAKGDRAAAVSLAEPVAGMLRTLNTTPAIDSTPLQNCRLAAAQIAEGMTDVANGQRWQNRDRFTNALSSCR